MTDREIKLLKDTLDFVYYYNQNPGFREGINRKMATGTYHLGRPIFFYIQMLIIYSPIFRRRYMQLTRTPAVSKIKYFTKKEPSVIETFLSSCYWNYRSEYNNLWNLTSPPGIFSSQEMETVEQLTQQPDSPKKEILFSNFLERKPSVQDYPDASPHSVDQIAAKIKNPDEITDLHKKQAEELLTQKIKDHGLAIANPQNRKELIEKGLCTESEVKTILQYGLVRALDVEAEFNKEGFQSLEETKKAISEAAERLLKDQSQQWVDKEAMEKPPEPPLTAKTLPPAHPQVELATPAVQPLPVEELNKELASYAQQSGKEVKYVEKSHPVHATAEELNRVEQLAKIPVNIPEPAQKLAKDVVSLAKRAIIRNSPTVVSATIGGFAGGAIGGLAGVAPGVIGGGLLPQVVKMGATQTALKGAGGLAIKGALGLSNPAGWAWLASDLPGLKQAKNTALKKAFPVIKYAVIGILAFFFIPLFMNINKASSLLPPYDIAYSAPNITPGGPTPTPGGGPGPGGGDIASCTFYRGGDSIPGQKFNIPEWPALINEVTSKVGVPSSVLAAILRVEYPTGFASDNPAYITNDYDAHTNNLAYGAMQFYPPTFEGVFNNNSQSINTLFQKTSVKTTIDPQDQMAPSNVLRIYSIRDSLISAAFKIKSDAGNNPPYDRAVIDRIVKSYFTQCEYTQNNGTFNYCDDVWRSYQGCQSGPAPTPTPTPSPTPPPSTGLALSCPLSGAIVITCGTFYNPINGCGHGNPNYGYQKCTSPPYASCPNGEFTEQLKQAIDVDLRGRSSANTQVFLPMINGSTDNIWIKVAGPTLINSQWGYKAIYETTYNNLRLTLDLTHINEKVRAQANSGQQVASVKPRVDNEKGPEKDPEDKQHLHTAIAINDIWTNPAQVSMCF